MLDLPTIWANRLRVIAANLKFDEREYREVAATAQHVRWDYNGRFLIELIQNAADQATRAGLSESEIVIVRTSELLAVLNQGRPLDDDGLRALTSLSYDTKDPALTIGNKGLGFKAVFQISDAPEVYSAPMAGGGLLAGGGYRFAFSAKPLGDSAVLGELGRVAAEFEREDPAVARRISEQHGGAPFGEVLAAEASLGAPFRFPLPLDELALRERIDALDLSLNDVGGAAALIVLPLNGEPDVQRWVEEAIAGLVNDADAATLLFLSGVGSLRLEDRRCCVTHLLERRAATEPSVADAGPRHARVSHCTTRHTRTVQNGDRTAHIRCWWICSRTLGSAVDSDAETAVEERQRILQAVASLPGQHWAQVDHATVDVALPLPRDGSRRGQPLGTGGLFCIGLPTQMGTGMPLWVNALFHGNIARREIDFEQNAFNQILFQEATELASDLIDALKSADDVASRRLVTLALEFSPDSVLRSALQRSKGLFEGDVVLGEDGVTFMSAAAVSLPQEQDLAMYRLLSRADPERDGGFTLPDAWLMRNARSVLRQLGASEGPSSGPDHRFLDRADDVPSLVERGAHLYRRSGPSFWGPFVRWLLDRYPADLLADQRVLPTGTIALSTAGEKVYAAPTLPESSLAGFAADDPRRLDHLIAARLRLFDEQCLAIREPDGRKFTPLGNRLRQTDPAIVREPVLSTLVREVFGPRLQELTAGEGNESEAIALLRIVAEWAQARDAKDLPLGALRVPTESDEAPGWAWRVPTRTYLGRGWQDAETETLLMQAYGGTAGRLIVPWPLFASAAAAAYDQRESWIRALQTLGVRAGPRISVYTHGSAPLQSYSYTGPLLRAQGSRCPPALTALEKHWTGYIETIRHRRAAVMSGQSYDVEKLLWVDGLESDEVRADVVALMLRRPLMYERYLTTKLGRVQGYGDSTEVPSFWAHALSHSGWRTVPTTHGLVAPDEAWLLVGEQQRHRHERYRFLPCVVEDAEPAQRLLLAIGVSTLGEAPPKRYVSALQAIAARLAAMRPDEMADAIVLTEELYRELQSRLAAETIDLPSLLEAPLPMFDGIEGRRLRAVDFHDPPVILVNDNPVRARFVEGARDSAVLPISPRRGYAALVAAIEAQMDEGVVRYTRDAPVDVKFTPNGVPETTVATYLERAFPDHPLRRDIALLLSAAAASGADPSSDRIRESLKRFDIVQLRFGTFGGDTTVASFLHEGDEEGPLLLVDEALQSSPERVFAATWELVGAHRDLWASYAIALRDGATERFFGERGVIAADKRHVEALLEPVSTARFEAVKSLVLAIGVGAGMVADAEGFAIEWPVHSRSADDLARWVGRSDLADAIALAASKEDEGQAALLLLDAAGLSSGQWQSARELLGLPPHLFVGSRRAFERARDTAVAALMATAAHAVSVDLAEARGFLEAVNDLQPPQALLYEPRTQSQMLPHVLAATKEILLASAAESLGVLLSRLEEGLTASDAQAEEMLLMRVARREVDEYRLPEAVRTTSARRDADIVLSAARDLAVRLSEPLDTTTIGTQGRVAALSSGWWANRFALLDALRQALQEVAPLTTRRLSDERAFRDPGPPGVLVGRIRELTHSLPRPAPTILAPRVVAVVGVSLSRPELDTDFAHGSDGRVGTELRRHAAPPVDFETVRKTEPPPARSSGRRGGWSAGRRGSRPAADNQDEREINGLLGEAFVYELFREHLPGFDYQCWRSMNAVRYGVAEEGDDTLGADFIYQDSSGLLTGRRDSPEVYLEIKATSQEGSTPFDVSAGEWETALRIHLGDDARAYAIVRIEHVRSAPTFHRIYIDPVRLSREGLLVVEEADLRVYGA